MWAQKVKKMWNNVPKQTNFGENAPMWVQKVKKSRNVQSGRISMKTHQCERKKSKQFHEMSKADEFWWKCTNVSAKSQKNVKKRAKQTNFDEHAPMWEQKVKIFQEMHKADNFQWKRTNVSAKGQKYVKKRIFMKMHQCEHKKSKKINEIRKAADFWWKRTNVST